MGTGFKHGAGGSNPLNFKVIGSTTAPSNPKENTIWVNTSTTITNYVFSATQPTGSAGMVWITIGTSSTVEFSATKKNPIMVYPLSAKQYIGGAWVDKTAKSYQGGQWVNWWNGELYTPGNEWTQQTGGWYISRNNDATLSKNTDNMLFVSGSGQSSSAITIQKATEFDYSKYKTVCVTVSNYSKTSKSSNLELLFRTGTNHDTSSTINSYMHTSPISTETTLKLEVPSNAQKAFLIYLYHGSLKIKKIWLE